MSILHRSAAIGALAAGLLAALPATAQLVPGNSAPAAILPVDQIPLSQDVDYPGTMRVEVDATDLTNRVYRVKQTIPVAKAGRMTLLVPKWLPGKHSPRGTVNRIAELEFYADGKRIPWTRDPVEVFAFHIDPPAGTRTVEARFTALTAFTPAQGRVEITPSMISLQFEDVSLYPAGYYTRRIPVVASVTYPAGWQAATALRPATTSGSTVTYKSVNYETLQDSPILAGAHYRKDQLDPQVALHTFAKTKDGLAPVNMDLIAKMKAMVGQADKLFGVRHFDHYDFLNSASDELGGIGLEHHRSTEISSEDDFLTAKSWPAEEHQVFPHEYVHSWDGKYRRPADLFTPDFHTPMRDTLLWVYEGQTQFWGFVLDARSGLTDKQGALDYLAQTAARYDRTIGRRWRPLVDTTHDPITTYRQPQPFGSILRNEDYYSEGLLIWMEADAIIRKGTGNARGMDDFARRFFGGRNGDWGEALYTRKEVIDDLNAVYPYDWTKFLGDRVDTVRERAPLDWIAASGYALEYRSTPNALAAGTLKATGGIDFGYSLGATVSKDGKVEGMRFDDVAMRSGLRIGDQIVAVGGQAYSPAALEAALAAAKASRKPIRLTVKRGETVMPMDVAYYDGPRYPHLVKVGTGDGPLDILLRAR